MYAALLSQSDSPACDVFKLPRHMTSSYQGAFWTRRFASLTHALVRCTEQERVYTTDDLEPGDILEGKVCCRLRSQMAVETCFRNGLCLKAR